MGAAAVSQRLVDQWSDPRWRLDNLYTITDENGYAVPFRMNWAQEALFSGMHYLNTILKARQLGFTTFIQLLMLDACLFNSNVSCGTIAHNLEDAKAIFRDKVKFPYDSLDGGLKAANPAVQDSANRLSFANNSSIRVGTSLRSGTLQYLHVSEFGKICAKYPDKAREVRTGAFNTVQAGQIILVESTAEGREGGFYDLCATARNLESAGRHPTPLDFKFHFFPWWRDPKYRMSEPVPIAADLGAYFAKLAAEDGIKLDDEQRWWYAGKYSTQQEDMKREYPSTPDEAFEASIEGAYFAKQMARARQEGRICRVPIETSIPVNTFWDLGMNDSMVIWFHQRVGLENRFIDYYENSGEGFPHYAQVLQSKGYVYGEHYGPHDLSVQEMGRGKTRLEQAHEIGITFRVVPRVEDKGDGIEASRSALASSWFDETRCARGIAHLDAYRKEWDDKLGVWKSYPRHDAASHGADGYQTFATGYQPSSTWGTPINYRPSGII